ncbi:MAG: DUF2062 domain-containing protein [Bacteroidota bacterium]
MKKSKSQYQQRFKEKKCCVLIPTYNNATTITDVIKGVLEYCHDVYVINDGSTDNTVSLLEGFNTSIKIISYQQNQGKGHALKTGFRKAIEDGFEYAVTIDSDGQHFAHDLPVFLEKLEDEPNAVIIGARQLNQENMSGGSSFANKFSNFWFKVETSYSLQDTQSGYRLYPLKHISKMRFFTKKYEFEIEIMVRLSWRGCKVISVPIDVFYPTKEERISHFRPFKDFFRISILNTVLVFLALIFFLPRNIIWKYKKKKLKQIIKEDIFGSNIPTHKIAISIGFGVFMGIVPIWGYQLAAGFALAHIFKLNKSIFFVFANISLPPMIPLILYLSYILGAALFGEINWLINIDNISFETIKDNLKLYLVGSMALAVLAGSLFGIASYFILKFSARKK